MLTVSHATTDLPLRAWKGIARRLSDGGGDCRERPCGCSTAGGRGDHPAIDYEQLRQRLRGADPVVHRILGLFPDECVAGLAELQQRIRAQEWTEAAELAHRLKGAAGTIAAADLRLAAGSVEDACRSHDPQRVPPALLELYHEARRAVEYVEAILARP